MALGYVRPGTLALALLAGGCVTTNSGAAALDRAAAPGGEIQLFAEGTRCAVRAKHGAPLVLNLPAPCVFVRKPGVADPTVYHYGDDVGSVYLVVGGLEPKAKEGICGVAAQSVAIRAGALVAGGLDDTPNAHCIGAKTDEKLYYGLSHP